MLVEFALVLPLLLAVGIGSALSGLAILDTLRLEHRLQQAANAGAGAPEPCQAAIDALQRLSGPPDASCDVQDGILIISATGATYALPFLPVSLSVEGSASAIIIEGGTP